jgi:hypothetical protein
MGTSRIKNGRRRNKKHARQPGPEWRRDTCQPRSTPSNISQSPERPSSTSSTSSTIFPLVARTSPIQQAAYWSDADSDLHRVRRHREGWVPIETVNTETRLVCVDPDRDIGDGLVRGVVPICAHTSRKGNAHPRRLQPALAAGWAPRTDPGTDDSSIARPALRPETQAFCQAQEPGHGRVRSPGAFGSKTPNTNNPITLTTALLGE